MLRPRLASLLRYWSFALLLVGGGLKSTPIAAQVPIGQWQLHVPGASANRVLEVDNTIYAAGEFGFFRYDLTDNTVRTLSKQDGFSDVSVAALAFDSATSQIVIGYSDTNIDLFNPRSGQITNLTDIKRKDIIGDKFISSITAVGGRAYLACSFGVVEVDLRRLEVANTFAGLGPAGQTVRILSTAVLRDSLYATTTDGIIGGDMRDNLLDFSRWQRFPNTANCPSIAAFAGHIYAVQDYSGLLRRNGNSWSQVDALSGSTFRIPSLTVGRGVLAVAQNRFDPMAQITNTEVAIFQANGTKTSFAAGQGDIYQALPGRDATYYLADNSKGLLQVNATTGATIAVIAPNGPLTNLNFSTTTVGGDTYAFGGGYNSGTGGTNRSVGFGRFHEGRWENYSAALLPGANQYFTSHDLNLSVGAWNPVNQKLYIGSYGRGLIEWAGPGSFDTFDESNSPLQPADAVPGNAPGYTRVTGLAVDAQGIVWLVNFVNDRLTAPGLYSFNPSTRAFQAHLVGYSGATKRQFVVIDDNGFKWFSGFSSRAGSDGIIVYDDRTGQARTLSTSASSGGLVGDVHCLVKDRKGDIWVGTSKGVQVCYNTASVFPINQAYTARQPIVDRRPLLDGQLIRAIAVDGANRKWIGTDDGVYLFNEDGDEAIAHYTVNNSPLPSNSILMNSLTVNGVTGEVFIGTDRGLVSFRGTATEPPADGKPSECTTIFPNPVPARFSGEVAIDGLTGGAIVKITDIAGQLVYQTTANGSRAVWNTKDYNGRRVRTGVYLAYSSDADGNNTCISKIAVIGE